MLAALLGTAAKAAVTGAAGLAVIGVLKEAKVGDTVRDVVVTVTEVGMRGFKLVEASLEKVADVATDVFNKAWHRADAEPATATPDDVDDIVAAAEAVAAESAPAGSDEPKAGPDSATE